ncbi:MAG TPA: aminoacyl-tRNA hydrolase [Anaerolineaceae bacterium]|nr:aminoacyl-tRNA hydrolase [Anaerolineaceae bacterium]HOU43242.1 aminoacyl-tRNA hydrolase [Anaerolineaceae bacterium]HQF44810.1 aminoacyl-tRNA hydrolase [Anaerolineaceae bacterium]HQH34722.1 aminoacyl-tRNA hydrolase [Anaerolineaceae bacterium]HQJ02804.1 aminoacyl-tRNA hydrolase [Anaerolineaceae bacterium]
MEALFEKLKSLRSSKDDQESTPGMVYLLVGLGNPGREYRDSRHNVGFMAIDRIASAWDVRLSRAQSKAILGNGVRLGKKVILAKPQTYMNLSGESVSALVNFYKIPKERLLVFHDDLDLPLGSIRLRPTGGSAGQKGIGSIIQKLGSQDFPRVRIGIGRPPGRMDPADYVLQSFGKDEEAVVRIVLDQVLESVEIFLEQGLEQAMNLYNGPVARE